MDKAFRKRRANLKDSKDPFIREFGQCCLLIDKRKISEALPRLDVLMVTANTLEQQSKIRCAVGDSQFILGRYQEALDHYSSVINLLSNSESRDWLRPSIGALRAALKLGDIDKARKIAESSWIKAAELENTFNRKLTLVPKTLRQNKIAEIPVRPIRPSVALSRLGAAFLEAGHPEIAAELFKQATVLSPRGASRARLGLANIMLSSNEMESAERYSRECLQMGKFQAKTINAWPVFIASRTRQGKSALDSDIFTALTLTNLSSVKQRAFLIIARTLRSHNDPTWKHIAQFLDNKNPVVTAEFLKISASDATLSASAQEMEALATKITDIELSSPSEHIFAAKLRVTAKILNGSEVNTQNIVAKTGQLYGEAVQSASLHGCALAAAAAGSLALARDILLDQLSNPKLSTTQRSKSIWALARIERDMGLPADAASRFISIAENTAIPETYRMRAVSMWADICAKSQLPIDENKIDARLRRVLSSVTKTETLLDFAQKVAALGPTYRPLYLEIVGRAESAALQAIRSTKTPEKRLRLLVHLARRQFFDFDNSKGLISLWRSFSPVQLNQMRTVSSQFWEYQGLVVRALISLGQRSEAISIINNVLDDKSSPTTAQVTLGSLYAEYLLTVNKVREALNYYLWLSTVDPLNRLNSMSHYWLALQAYVQNDKKQTLMYLQATKRCFAKGLGYKWEQRLLLRTNLLQMRITQEEAIGDALNFAADQLIADEQDRLSADIKLIANS